MQNNSNGVESEIIPDILIQEFTNITLNPNSFNQILSIIYRRLISTSREFNTIILILLPCFIMGFIALMFSLQERDKNFAKIEPI